ncbi:MAG: hypothetical protein ACOYEV_16445 [Candidatus Nanopelagicales bacterium]
MAGQDFKSKAAILLRARFSLLVIGTIEEERALKSLRDVCVDLKRPGYTWDIADGFSALTEAGPISASDPMSALERIAAAEGNGVYILKDFHDFWKDVRVRRKLRNVAQALKYTSKTVMIIAPPGAIPAELQDEPFRSSFRRQMKRSYLVFSSLWSERPVCAMN